MAAKRSANRGADLTAPILSLLVLFGVAHPAQGSFESFVQAAQPLHVRSGETSSSVKISRVAYIGHDIDPTNRGGAIALTVAPNSIWCDGRIENRNLASLAGIQFHFEMIAELGAGGMRIALRDTIHITVTIRGGDETLDPTPETILQATLWCGLLNARQVWPDVRFVDYKVVHAELASYSGTYSLESVQSSAAVIWGRHELTELEACRVSTKSQAETQAPVKRGPR